MVSDFLFGIIVLISICLVFYPFIAWGHYYDKIHKYNYPSIRFRTVLKFYKSRPGWATGYMNLLTHDEGYLNYDYVEFKHLDYCNKFKLGPIGYILYLPWLFIVHTKIKLKENRESMNEIEKKLDLD